MKIEWNIIKDGISAKVRIEKPSETFDSIKDIREHLTRYGIPETWLALPKGDLRLLCFMSLGLKTPVKVEHKFSQHISELVGHKVRVTEYEKDMTAPFPGWRFKAAGRWYRANTFLTKHFDDEPTVPFGLEVQDNDKTYNGYKIYDCVITTTM